MLALAQIDPRAFAPPLWATFTLHHAREPGDQPSRELFDELMQWLRREAPGTQYIWRLELQKRGVEHWHALLWLPIAAPNPFQSGLVRRLRQRWTAIAAPGDADHRAHGAHIKPTKGWRAAARYLSAYAAKEDEASAARYQGRRWGRSAGLKASPLIDLPCPLDLALYLRRVLHRWLRRKASRREWANAYFEREHRISIFCDGPRIARLILLYARFAPGSLGKELIHACQELLELGPQVADESARRPRR
jgi:hypothetical protein